MIASKLRPRLFILYITGMVLATLFDFQITDFLTARQHSWAIYCETLGEAPALLFTVFNFSIVCAYCRKNKSLIHFALSFLGSLISSMYAFERTFSYHANTNTLPLSLPISIGFSFILLFICLRLSGESIQKYYKIALACIGAAISTLIIITSIKLLWGRVRYRQLAADSTLAFTDWYIINGPGQPMHASFPSGHTANAAIIMMASLYFPKQKHWLQPLLYAYILLMAVSRLCVGAHFLSDILTGCAITFLLAEFWVHKFKVSIWSKNDQNNSPLPAHPQTECSI
ncbi:MAG: phosphatase PAP2 family protein [Clostridiales bacterium]|nr:phosphatase PAP2 family protein [Clostridiales bacterium]